MYREGGHHWNTNFLRRFVANWTYPERIVFRHGRRISKKCLLWFHKIAWWRRYINKSIKLTTLNLIIDDHCFPPGFQNLIGYTEVKPKPTYFGIPKSCANLKGTGHTSSGLYSIMGTSKVESVFCDFTKLPNDSGSFKSNKNRITGLLIVSI